MTEHIFTIEYSNIVERMTIESSYVAVAREAAGLPANLPRRTMVTEDEAKILDNAIQSAIDGCIVNISRYLGEASATHDAKNRKSTVSIVLPANYPTANVNALENAMKDVVTFQSLQHWYLTAKPDEAGTVAAKLQPLQMKLREVLSLRNRPAKEVNNQTETLS